VIVDAAIGLRNSVRHIVTAVGHSAAPRSRSGDPGSILGVSSGAARGSGCFVW